jgi:release factor glutamine methyltransferase
MKLAEVLKGAVDYLAARGVESPRVDAELLLARALELQRIELYTQHDRPLTEAERAAARELVRRRGAREPLAYVLGDWDFRRLTLKTDRRALVPRPETEIVVERALAHLRRLEAPRVLDVGAGTGAIALAVADEHPGAWVTAIDVSPDALDLARANARRTGLAVEFREHDFRRGLVGGPYDLVISNPPYVEERELPKLMPDVRDWEPHVALVGQGATEAVARGATAVLVPGGWLVLEVGDGQAARTAALLGELGYREIGSLPDLNGRDRVVEARR